MWNTLPDGPDSQRAFHDWILAIYDDAALYAASRLGLCLAEAVNHAIQYTLEELQQREAPDGLVAAIGKRLMDERRSLMFSLARQLGRDGLPPVPLGLTIA